MSLWKIAWRSIQQRSLASLLTALSMALGVTLVVAVLVVGGAVDKSFEDNAGLGYHLIIGAKGGKTQLVLNTVYHLSSPVENIPYSFYKEFLSSAQRKDGLNGKFAPFVDKAIPVCMGDYFRGFRVVGTIPDMFTDVGSGQRYGFSAGENFKSDDFWGAVVGSVVAREAQMTVGTEFSPTHGAEEGHKHEEKFHVVGVLAPSGTPADRAVYVNMEGFYLMEGHAKEAVGEKAEGDEHAHKDEEHEHGAGEEHDHDHDHGAHHHGPLPESQREVTAILVRTTSDIYAQGLPKIINKGQVAQAVAPIYEITSLLDVFVRPLRIVLLTLTGLIVVVSGLGIMVSIYNSMSERRHEIAIMRALGAGRSTVMQIVLLESILLALGGGLMGWLLGHSLIGVLSPWILEQTGVSLGFFQFIPALELILIPALIVLAALVGYLPALAAYRTDVAKSLTANP